MSVIITAIALFTLQLCAQEFFPKQTAITRPDPIASPYALPGGTICEYLGPSPKSLNYYLDNNTMSAQIFGSMYESLLDMNPQTLEYDRALAEKWSISEDKREFTFWLDPKARWSDGRPVSVADVIWTYQAVVDPANMTGPHKLSLERLQPPVSVDDGRAVRFVAKEVHWQNLGAASGFPILPKHVYEKMDFNKLNFDFPVVSGPFRFQELKEGLYLLLARRRDWWRNDWPVLQGIYNFDYNRYLFFNDRENAFEAFKKGEIDMFPVYTASQWYKLEEKLSAVRNNWIVKQAIYNHKPVGFQGFAMNMRRAPFDDVRVRKAMAHLINRPMMNHTMMYDQYFLHRSYWEDLYDQQHPCPNEMVDFNPGQARALLAEAGWKANPQTGILEKNGRPLSFVFLSRDSSSDKFLAPFTEALKDVGVQMTVQNKDWSAWAKDMDEFNFDMTWAAWGAGLFKNPEYLWSSQEADRPGSSNITGFKNARVDALIEKQKTIFDVAERHAIVREIDAIIFAEHPYALLWNLNYTRLLYWNKFGVPPTVIGKYSSESSAYWWYDPDGAAELQEAMAGGAPLPQPPAEVHYDQVLSEK
ncbi:MAG: ABC transporter substrate-binding protein [Lentisphaerae bacterium]|jgi:microcin C transport system substrate-binding protein|nr:ABC transporter substrate-binding protein [Lentisphaerota bacterium]